MRLFFYNADRWMRCGKSADPAPIIADIEPGDDTIRREGVAAHWVADAVLFGDANGVEDFEGETAPNGITVDMEMMHGARQYIDTARSVAVDLKSEHNASIFGIRGRVDVYGRTLRGVFVGDLKYGYRPPPATTWQLTIGALAVIGNRHTLSATVGICAPRARSGEPWEFATYTAAEMAALRKQVHDRVTDLELGERSATTGKHCRHCDHAATCGALVDRIQELRHTVELEELYELRDLIKTRIVATESEMTARLNRGDHVPGWWLKPQIGNRRFKVDAATVEIMTGLPSWKRVEKSPNELEKEGAPRKILDAITTRPDTGVKLARWNPDDAAKIFGDKNA